MVPFDSSGMDIVCEDLNVAPLGSDVSGLQQHVDQVRSMSTNDLARVLINEPSATTLSSPSSSTKATVNILAKLGSKLSEEAQQQRGREEEAHDKDTLMVAMSPPRTFTGDRMSECRYRNQGITTNNNTNEEMKLVNNNKSITSSDDINNNQTSSGTGSKARLSSSSSLSTENQNPRIMIPLPVRLPPLVCDQNNQQKVGEEGGGGGAEDVDEAVINMANALISISSSELSSSSAPSVASSSPPTEDPDHKSIEVDNSDGNKSESEKEELAYAKLKGPDWSFLMKKPSLTMGRSPAHSKQFSQGDSCPVDFYLSSADSLSRTHLRIDYNPDRVRWEMSCLGKSGVRVDRRRYEAFCPPIPLYNESSVTVANATFTFNLPSDAVSRESSPFFGKVHKKRKSSGTAIEGLNDHPSHSNESQNIEDSEADKLLGLEDEEDEEEEDYEDTSDLVGSGEYSKPPQSYANLIAEAINSTPNQRMTLSCIYQFLADKYPYFRHTKNGWQNSVRHNLSLNKAFKKVPRGTDDPGKGMMWVIDADYKHLVDGSIGRRATLRSRTPEFGANALVNGQRPPPPQLTFVHHQSMFQPPTSFHRHHQGYPVPPQFLAMAPYPHPQQQSQQQHQPQQQFMQQPFYYQQMRQAHILPAPDPSHLRPMAKIAAVISQSATAMSNPAPSNATSSSSSTT